MKTTIALLLLIGICTIFCGCSMIDKDKISGLGEMTKWKIESEMKARSAPENCKDNYEKARIEIEAYKAEQNTIINQLETQYFSKIDLSKEKLPSSLSSSVTQFLQCRAAPVPGLQNAPRITPTAQQTEQVEKALNDIISWGEKVAKERRKASGEALKLEINKLTWETWERVRTP